MHWIVSIVIWFLLYAFVWCLVKQQCTKIESFVFTGVEDGPDIVLIGGTHGNEPAGADAMENLVSLLKTGGLRLARGRVTIIPKANPCGLKLGMRWQPHQMMLLHKMDLNRNYSMEEGDACDVSRSLQKIVQGKDYVYDAHEAWGWTQENRKSMGSAVYSGRTLEEHQLAQSVADAINRETSPSSHSKRFIAQDWHDQEGSLRWYCGKQGIPYVLVETTGQGNIQPLGLRVKQHMVAATTLMKELQMLA